MECGLELMVFSLKDMLVCMSHDEVSNNAAYLLISPSLNYSSYHTISVIRESQWTAIVFTTIDSKAPKLLSWAAMKENVRSRDTVHRSIT